MLFHKMRPVISTNGHFLMKKLPDACRFSPEKIIIPYDGATPGIYNVYRKGGDLVQVSDGIRALPG